jgi:uncharacterized protein
MTQLPFETIANRQTLRGTAYVPAGPGPHRTVVLFHGFGGSRVEGARSFVQLARALNRAGWAAISYDRAGHGESDGEFFDTTASGDVADGRQVLGAISVLPYVARGGVHLVGLSLGAVIAAAVASESPVPVRSVTLWSSAAVFVDEIASGAIQGKRLDSLETEGYFDFYGQRMGPAMVADARTFDPYARAAGYRGPVRILHGSEDFVPVDYAYRYQALFGDRAELTVVPGADHGWLTVPHRELVIGETVDFITRCEERLG